MFTLLSIFAFLFYLLLFYNCCYSSHIQSGFFSFPFFLFLSFFFSFRPEKLILIANFNRFWSNISIHILSPTKDKYHIYVHAGKREKRRKVEGEKEKRRKGEKKKKKKKKKENNVKKQEKI